MSDMPRMICIAIGCMIVTSRVAFAQSSGDLAKQTQNPVASLISVPLQANWDVGVGTREAVVNAVCTPSRRQTGLRGALAAASVS